MERRESPAIEKAIETMTLEDLIATQAMEPLSESRRSFLTNGYGVLSLQQELETMDSDAPATLADAIAADNPDRVTNTDRDAIRYGTPEVPYDLVTMRQIAWETQAAQAGSTHSYHLAAGDDGSLRAIRKSGWTSNDTLRVIVGKFRQYMIRLYGADALASYAALQAKMDLLTEAFQSNGVPSTPEGALAYERWAVEQAQNPPWSPEEVDHSNYEQTREALLGKRGRLYFFDELNERQALRLVKAGAEPVIVITGTVHRASRNGKSDDALLTWHHTARDANELDVTGIMDSLPRLIRLADIA